MLIDLNAIAPAKLPPSGISLADNPKRTGSLIVDWGSMLSNVFFATCAAGAVWTEGDISAEFKERMKREAYRLSWLWPDRYVFVCMDSKPYFRTEFYPEYKNKASRGFWPHVAEQCGYEREHRKEDCLAALAWASEVLGWRRVEAPGLEADDLAHLLATSMGGNISFVTGDEDWQQIPHHMGRTAELYYYNLKRADGTTGEVRVDVTPDMAKEVLLVKTACGDSSDNVISAFRKNATQRYAKAGFTKERDKRGMGTQEFIDYLLATDPTSVESWELNDRLVNMARIPDVHRECGMVAIRELKGQPSARSPEHIKEFADKQGTVDFMVGRYAGHM